MAVYIDRGILLTFDSVAHKESTKPKAWVRNKDVLYAGGQYKGRSSSQKADLHRQNYIFYISNRLSHLTITLYQLNVFN